MQATACRLQDPDRRDVSLINAFAFGVGHPTSYRVASRPMTSFGPWKQGPTPISKPANGSSHFRGQKNSNMRRNAASNPYAAKRMKDTLTSGAGPGLGPSGGFDEPANRTVGQTILGKSSNRPPNSTYNISNSNQAKRQKTGHAQNASLTSGYFADGAAGTRSTRNLNGNSKSKGKQPMRGGTASEPETLSSDEEEDIGECISRPRQLTPQEVKAQDSTRESPDPLNLFESTSSDVQIPASPHPFDQPSRNGPTRGGRLPPDGQSTRRLQERQKQKQRASNEHDVIEIEVLSDDIESVDDDPAQRPVVTPNGRSHIPHGNVKQKVDMYEGKEERLQRGMLRMGRPEPKSATKPEPSSKPASKSESTPFFDLRQQRSVVGGMKPRNQKSPIHLQAQAPLSHSNYRLPTQQLDSIATSSSGFREDLPILPLEAWSVGCKLEATQDNTVPVAWLELQHMPNHNTYTVRVIKNIAQRKAKPLADWRLDRDFDNVVYSDPAEEWTDDSVAVVKLRTTKTQAGKSKVEGYQAGSRRATGDVSFKFSIRHANWMNDSGSGYRNLITILKSQIREDGGNREILRGPSSASCWQAVEVAFQRHSSGRATRPTTTSSRQSPMSVSAGPTNDSSTVVPDSQPSSPSAPPSRNYGLPSFERRTTRQSARRTSPSPDLDELVLVYPFLGTGAVNITRGDLKRLDAGQYLNDTVIEFGLKVWLDDLRKTRPELAEQVHVFNSFFYKKLVGKRKVALTYESVRKWTSKVDIFNKKYIIVPINENFHWYLAIIENPENMLHPPPPDVVVEKPQTRKRKRDSEASAVPVPVENTDVAVEGDGQDTPATTKQASEHPPEQEPDVMAVDTAESDREGAEVNDMLSFNQSCTITEPEDEHVPQAQAQDKYPISDDMDVDPAPGPIDDGDRQRKSPDRERRASHSQPIPVDDGDAGIGNDTKPSEEVESARESPKDDFTDEVPSGGGEDAAEAPNLPEGLSQYPNCYIYTFDSLGGKHNAAAKHLGQYLRHEAVDKKKFQMEDTSVAIGKAAKSPMQNNFCDCGLYVLAFVEAFMRDPIVSSEAIRRSSMDWYTNTTLDLREAWRNRTLELCEQWKKERAAKEGAKDEPSGPKEKETESAKAKPIPEVIEDSGDDLEISEVHRPPSSKTSNRGGKKGAVGKANRLR